MLSTSFIKEEEQVAAYDKVAIFVAPAGQQAPARKRKAARRVRDDESDEEFDEEEEEEDQSDDDDYDVPAFKVCCFCMAPA